LHKSTGSKRSSQAHAPMQLQRSSYRSGAE
jgi:hypothetical protein